MYSSHFRYRTKRSIVRRDCAVVSFCNSSDFFHLRQAAGAAGIGLDYIDDFAFDQLFHAPDAGVSFAGAGLEALFAPLSLGIAAGLVVGKQIGVFGACWLAAKTKLASMPPEVTWRHIYGLSCLAGIGFTMSLFIGGLAFIDPDQIDAVKMGVLVGSLLSAVIGMTVLATAPRAATRPLNEVPSA